MRPRQTILAVVVCIALVAATPVASAEKVHTADENNGLVSPDAIQSYQGSGAASGTVAGVDMTVTIADDKRDAGVDGYTGGVMHTYIRVEYREEIDRTVRFYVPAEYFKPRLKDGETSMAGDDATAMFEPVAGGEYTAVTIQFRNQTDATFAVNDAFGVYLSTTDKAYSSVENVTGYRLPRLGTKGHAQWQYPPDGALAGENATYHIPVAPEKEDPMEMTIQYDKTPEEQESTWMTVKKCSQEIEPVCVTDRDGKPVLFSASGDTVPPIRYKPGSDPVSDAKSGWEELKDSWNGVLDGISDLFGTVTVTP